MSNENPEQPSKPDHQHRYLPQKSKVVVNDGVTQTVILLRCECGDFNHSTILGEWLFEEITNVAPANEGDEAFLKRLGISVSGDDYEQ
jgi:hypothetical protein